MLTLTLKHREKPLGQQITRIWRCFATMRREGCWKRHVHGFVAFLEVKHSRRTRCWHVHLHVIAEGTYFPHSTLRDDWHAATGDSQIVDIQMKGTAASMAAYGAKYASKPVNAGDMETAEIHAEAIAGIGRRRLWLIGGTWKGKLDLLEKGEDPGDWEYIGPANALFEEFAAGDENAVRIVTELYAPSKDARPPPSSRGLSTSAPGAAPRTPSGGGPPVPP